MENLHRRGTPDENLPKRGAPEPRVIPCPNIRMPKDVLKFSIPTKSDIIVGVMEKIAPANKPNMTARTTKLQSGP